MNNLLLVLVSALISFIVTPGVKKFAHYIGAIDVPKDKRKIHTKPTPLIGGLAIYIAFISVLIIKAGRLTNTEIGIILGATIIVLGGVLDDKMDLKPWQKLAFQTVASICLIIFGVKIEYLTNPVTSMGGYIDLHWLSIPFTMIWVIGVTNALNLIDGLDGLASGIALISTISIFVISIINYRYEAALLTIILGGSILGFLPYNFNPASIFLGDAGSQLLGFLLAAISMTGAVKSVAAFSIAVPILALGLPIYDTLFAMIRRKVNGKPIMQADRGHLHHRLLDMGLTQRQVVVIMYFISAILGGIAIIAMQISTTKSYFLLTVVLIVIIAIAWKFGFFKHKE